MWCARTRGGYVANQSIGNGDVAKLELTELYGQPIEQLNDTRSTRGERWFRLTYVPLWLYKFSPTRNSNVNHEPAVQTFTRTDVLALRNVFTVSFDYKHVPHAQVKHYA